MARSRSIDRAKAAYYNFQRLEPSLTGFAEALSGRTLQVKAGEITATSGDVILIQPPIALGDENVHARSMCDVRDDIGMMKCDACRVRESVMGYIFHELGHVVFDSFKKTALQGTQDFMLDYIEGDSRAQGRLISNWNKTEFKYINSIQHVSSSINKHLPGLVNALEDVRVDARMVDARPGVAAMHEANFNRVARLGYDSGRKVSDLDLNAQLSIAFLAKAKGFELEGVFDDYVLQTLEKEQIAKVVDVVASARTPQMIMNYAFKLLVEGQREGFFIYDEMHTYIPDEEEEDADPEEEPETSGEGDDSDSEPSEGDGDPQRSDGSGDSDSERDDSNTPDDDPSEGGGDSGSEGDVPPSDSESDSGSGDKEDSESEGDDSAHPESSKGDSDSPSGGDSSANSSSQSPMGADDSSENGDPASGADGPVGEPESRPSEHSENEREDSDSDADGGDEGAAEVPRPEPRDFGLDPDESVREVEVFTGHSDTEFSMTPQEATAIKQVVASLENFDDVSEAISGMEMRDPMNVNSDGFESVARRTPESVLGPATLHMRRVFTDNAKSNNERNMKSGRVNKRVLGRRAWGDDDRLFSKKTRPGKRDYAVLIGIDASGSTSSWSDGMTTIELELLAAKAQAELCHRMGIKFAVYAHTGSRSKLIVMPVKTFDQPWNDKAVKRMSRVDSMHANLDGHTLEFYRKEIEKVRATDKVIMYYSDGAMPAENYHEELRVLKREIKTCKSRGITLMAVGARTSDPRAHGLDTVRIDRLNQIDQVVKHLGKRLEES